ncbi:MAG: hypothetical protein R2911_12680 [Caldilineaceae bacterium]
MTPDEVAAARRGEWQIVLTPPAQFRDLGFPNWRAAICFACSGRRPAGADSGGGGR